MNAGEREAFLTVPEAAEWLRDQSIPVCQLLQ